MISEIYLTELTLHCSYREQINDALRGKDLYRGDLQIVYEVNSGHILHNYASLDHFILERGLYTHYVLNQPFMNQVYIESTCPEYN